jgi:hypothetical protein
LSSRFSALLRSGRKLHHFRLPRSRQIQHRIPVYSLLHHAIKPTLHQRSHHIPLPTHRSGIKPRGRTTVTFLQASYMLQHELHGVCTDCQSQLHKVASLNRNFRIHFRGVLQKQPNCLDFMPPRIVVQGPAFVSSLLHGGPGPAAPSLQCARHAWHCMWLGLPCFSYWTTSPPYLNTRGAIRASSKSAKTFSGVGSTILTLIEARVVVATR